VTDDGDAKSERDRKLSRTKSANVLQMTKALQKEALAAAAVQTAYHVEAKLIVVFSHTGETTRLVARYHPHCVVLSLSIPTVRGGTLKWTVEGDQEARQQMLYRGVVPALSAGQPSAIDEEDDSDEEYDTIEDAGQSRTDREAMTTAHELGLIKPGELAVFCQLIGGLSTVKVVEFAGLDGGVATTFSPTASRSSSPSLFASGSPRSGGRAAGNVGNLGGVGTSTDLARLNIVDVAEIMSGDPDLMQRSPPLVVGGGPKRPPRGPAARGSSFRSRGSRSSMSSMASTKEK
jgi:pyruvate kinase